MASNSKKVSLEVAIKTQEEKLNALDKELEDVKKKATELSNTKLQMKIDANTTKLKEVNSQIKSVEAELKNLKGKADVDDSEVKSLQSKLQSLKNQKINIQADIDQSKLQISRNNIQMKVDVEKSSLDRAKAEADSMDGQSITMTLDLAMQNFAQGIATCKQGISELYDNIKQVEQAGAQTEQNMAFLTMNLGAEKARDTFKEISDIVASMPGDDNTMRSVLSTAQALGNNLNTQEMKDAAATMADYMSASATMGKMAKESEQDIMKYLLDGNTAELERGSIVSQYVDKLKDATTFQERQKAMQEVLNQLGYGGISQQDTLLNKQAEWEGMIYNSQSALSSMWLDAEKGAMDYILKLNEASDGMVGMGIVAGQMVLGPFTEIMTGLGQIGVGFKTLKEAADFTGITTKLGQLKNTLLNVGAKARTVAADFASTLAKGLKTAGGAAKDAAVWIGTNLKTALQSAGSAAKSAIVWIANAGKAALTAGYNALKAAGMWLYEKAQVAASAIAKAAAAIPTYALAIAEWFLASPILIVVAAILVLIGVLAYLYFTNEDVRNAINALGQSLWGLGGTIYNALVGAFEWLQGAWQNTVDWFNNGVNAIVGAFDAFNYAVQGAAQWIWDSLIAAFEYLQGAWQNTIDFLTSGGQMISDALTGVFDWLVQSFLNVVMFFTLYAQLIVQTLINMGVAILAAILSVINYFAMLPGRIVGILQNVIAGVISWVASLVSQFTSGAQRAVNGFLSPIRGLVDKVSAELSAVYNAVMGFIQPLIDAFNTLGSAASWAFSVLGLGQSSPGDIYKATRNELAWTTDLVKADTTGLVGTVGQLGKDVVKGWGNPTFGYSIEGTTDLSTGVTGLELSEILRLLGEMVSVMRDENDQGNISNTFNLYGDIDDDKRMEKFLNAVRKELAWNNKTAGRTV